MNAPTEGKDEQKRTQRSGEGSGEAGSATSGLVRASGDGVIRLSVEQQKTIWANFRKLDLNEVVAAVAEFFSEFPARASANLSVAWDGGNKGSFALVNMVIKFGQDVAMAVRERTRESAVQVRRRYGINLKFRKRGAAAAVSNPQANPS